MSGRRMKCQFAVSIAIWSLGALVLYVMWHWHIRSSGLDQLYGFALYVVVYFYVFAIYPILAAVQWNWPGARREREAGMRRLFGSGS